MQCEGVCIILDRLYFMQDLVVFRWSVYPPCILGCTGPKDLVLLSALWKKARNVLKASTLKSGVMLNDYIKELEGFKIWLALFQRNR